MNPLPQTPRHGLQNFPFLVPLGQVGGKIFSGLVTFCYVIFVRSQNLGKSTDMDHGAPIILVHRPGWGIPRLRLRLRLRHPVDSILILPGITAL